MHDKAIEQKPVPHLTVMRCLDDPTKLCRDNLKTCTQSGYECMDDGSEHVTHNTVDCDVCKAHRREVAKA